MKKAALILFAILIPALTICLLSSYGVDQAPLVSIVTDKSTGKPVLHGLTKLAEALDSKKIAFEKVTSSADAKGKFIIIAGLSSGEGEASRLMKSEKLKMTEVPEALAVRKTESGDKPVWLICGFDDVGLMYALQDVALSIKQNSDIRNPLNAIKEITEKPDVTERAISFYTMNRAYWESRFYDKAYWTRYMDMLSEDRFNSIVVIFGYENGGFLAPCYPYFFNTEGFPEVRMVGITQQEQERNLQALNLLIEMAHEHGIRLSVGIWDHIYRGGVQGGGIPGTKEAPDVPVHGLVWGVTGYNLISYTKASLNKFVKLVPALDGIQFRMHNESGLKREEQDLFWSDVFKMMKKSAPDLRLDLRAKELPESVIQSALDEKINFRITTKYWMEQMGMPFHPTRINPEKSERRHSYADMLRYPQQYKMHWRLWNGGTARILLWGDPDYVRRFAGSTHLYNGDGYEVNEPLATKMLAQPHDAKPFELLNAQYKYYDYEFERYWYFFRLFGRIGYNPDISSDYWLNEFEMRFGKKAAPLVESALDRASWILPRIIASCYPYSGFPMTRGWAEKQRLGDLPAYSNNEGSDILQFANFDEEAKILIDKGESCKILPSMNSRWFEKVSADIDMKIAGIEKIEPNTKNKELISTLTDLKILSGLALYHSERTGAAVSYRLFVRTGDAFALDEAISWESKAIDAWKSIVTAAGDVYTDDLMMGVRTANLSGHWKDELVQLESGLKALNQKRSGLKTDNGAVKAPRYRAASESDWQSKFKIEHQPVAENPSGQPVKISIKVTSGTGIKWVKLSYRSVNQDVEYQTIPMNPVKDGKTYEAIVAADQINPKWDFMYFISIMDNEKHGIIYPDLNKVTPYFIVRLIR